MQNILKTIIVFFLFYLLFLFFFSRTVANYDLWGYLSFGRIFWENGFFPFRDVFSYTPTKPLWVYHEWLTGVIFYFIFKHLGPSGLQLLQHLTVIITLSLIYATAIKKGASAVFTMIALAPAMLLVSFGYVPVRAQIFTYLFFVLTIYILEAAKINQKWTGLAWLLPVQILWCNLHGGFVAGLGITALYALGEGLSGKKTMPFVVIFFFAGLATLINPYGIEYWQFMINSITMPRPEISEWFSLINSIKNNYQIVPAVVFICLASISMLFLILRKKRNLTDTIVIAAMIYLGVKHVRHTIFFGIIFGAFFPVILSDLWKHYLAEKKVFIAGASWFPAAILACILLSANFIFVSSATMNIKPPFVISAPQSHYPLGALDWMRKNNFQGNILPDFDWGEFMMWSCHPYCKVAMDGRYETVYEDIFIKEYFVFLEGGPGWETFLQKYPHDLILIKPYAKIYFQMLQEFSWEIMYMDKQSVLFMRKNNR